MIASSATPARLKLGIPKGSLQEATLDLFARVGATEALEVSKDELTARMTRQQVTGKD